MHIHDRRKPDIVSRKSPNPPGPSSLHGRLLKTAFYFLLRHSLLRREDDLGLLNCQVDNSKQQRWMVGDIELHPPATMGKTPRASPGFKAEASVA